MAELLAVPTDSPLPIDPGALVFFFPFIPYVTALSGIG